MFSFVESLYLDNIVLAINDAVALRPLLLLVAPLLIVGHSCIFLARILDALPKMPGEWAASPPPHPSRKTHWSC